MTELYTIRFTTRKMINKFDGRGKLIAETRLDTPITMHMLPYSTAMAYSGCDNFVIEKYQSEERYHSKGAGRPTGVGNGHKSRYAGVSSGVKAGKELSATMASKNVEKSTINAATSGDMSAAVSR